MTMTIQYDYKQETFVFITNTMIINILMVFIAAVECIVISIIKHNNIHSIKKSMK